MTTKIKGYTGYSDGAFASVTCGYHFFCPGCKTIHGFRIVNYDPNANPPLPTWTFNGDLEKPTFSPSLLYQKENGAKQRCHLFMTNGELHFCGDSEHELAGKVVPIPDWPYGP